MQALAGASMRSDPRAVRRLLAGSVSTLCPCVVIAGTDYDAA